MEEMDQVGVVDQPSRFRRVCVFCGSSSGKRNCYQDAAVELGKELVGTLLLFFLVVSFLHLSDWFLA